jgi:hypothetical protein
VFANVLCFFENKSEKEKALSNEVVIWNKSISTNPKNDLGGIYVWLGVETCESNVCIDTREIASKSLGFASEIEKGLSS